jgi:hypothetical protein
MIDEGPMINNGVIGFLNSPAFSASWGLMTSCHTSQEVIAKLVDKTVKTDVVEQGSVDRLPHPWIRRHAFSSSRIDR